MLDSGAFAAKFRRVVARCGTHRTKPISIFPMKPYLNLILAAAASLLVVSCYPYPENKPQNRHRPNLEQQKKEEAEKAEKLKKEEEAKKKELEAAKEKEKEKENDKGIGENNPGGTEKPPGTPDKQEKQVKPQYEVAKKAPGREGFVLSPYNNRLIDVRGIASGTLVQDPTYDPAEKKFFRVP